MRKTWRVYPVRRLPGYYGGVPRTLITDNLRAAVTRADWFDPELNPKTEEFCRHYGTVMLPTRPAMPRHKGKIESGINFAQENALKGRSFESLSAQNIYLSDWESGVADTRIHGTTRQQVGNRVDYTYTFTQQEMWHRKGTAPTDSSVRRPARRSPKSASRRHGSGQNK